MTEYMKLSDLKTGMILIISEVEMKKKNLTPREIFEATFASSGLKRYDFAQWLGCAESMLSKRIREMNIANLSSSLDELFEFVKERRTEINDEDIANAWVKLMKQFSDSLMELYSRNEKDE